MNSAVFPPYVCRNPNCKSYGRSHPNCKCGAPSEGYAEGGVVCSLNGIHHPKCEYFADGGEVAENRELHENPSLAVDYAITNHGLHHALTRTGHTKSEDPTRAGSEFIDHSRRGRKALENHIAGLWDKKYPAQKSNQENVNALKSYLGNVQQNPDKALETGGMLGEYMPAHHAAIASKLASASNYLNSIKPHPSQIGPLDKIIPPSVAQQKAYERQIALTENPNLIYQHAKDGMLHPQDFQTLEAVYPQLRAKIQDKAFEFLTEAKTANREISQKQKRIIGSLIGQNLAFEQSPQAIQAIMKANAPSQQSSAPQQNGAKKATGVELKQINAVNKLYQMPDESRQIEDKAKL